MPGGKEYGPETVIPKLREAEVLMFQGKTRTDFRTDWGAGDERSEPPDPAISWGFALLIPSHP